MSADNIAVCIVYFNRAKQTIQCVESFALAGTPVYVLNNGSAAAQAKEVAKRLARWKNVIHLASDKNLGIADGRNKLIEATCARWLLFVDNDITIRQTDWLDNLRNHIRGSAGVDAFQPRIHNVWNNTWVRPVRLAIKDGKAEYKDPRADLTNCFPGGGSLIDRSVFSRFGMYNSGLMAFEDFELALRALKSGNELLVRSISDVTLLHDHQPAKTDYDRVAVFTRYDVARIAMAHQKVKEMYGVALDDNFESWVHQQVQDLINPGFVAWVRAKARNVRAALIFWFRQIRRPPNARKFERKSAC